VAGGEARVALRVLLGGRRAGRRPHPSSITLIALRTGRATVGAWQRHGADGVLPLQDGTFCPSASRNFPSGWAQGPARRARLASRHTRAARPCPGPRSVWQRRVRHRPQLVQHTQQGHRGGARGWRSGQAGSTQRCTSVPTAHTTDQQRRRPSLPEAKHSGTTHTYEIRGEGRALVCGGGREEQGVWWVRGSHPQQAHKDSQSNHAVFQFANMRPRSGPHFCWVGSTRGNNLTQQQ